VTSRQDQASRIRASDSSHAHAGREFIIEKERVDVLTLLVALAVYGGYATLTWFFRDLPLSVFAPLCAICLTWYGSLQHETIHNHPTPSRQFNRSLAFLPLSLWIPYRIYSATHLQHHRYDGRHLTETEHDPESFYVRPGSLLLYGSLRRRLHLMNCTLAGRLILGPALSVSRLWFAEFRAIIAGDSRRTVIWTRHLLTVALVLFWLQGVCHIPLGVYLMLVVYPSIALTHLRSFVEHRADIKASRRTVVVEASPLWSLLFLNNNLHIAHHAHPKVPWHLLPSVWRRMRSDSVQRDLVYSGGYMEVAKQYLWRPVLSIEHPGAPETPLGMLPMKT
jgi:fatty acid desaturase